MFIKQLIQFFIFIVISLELGASNKTIDYKNEIIVRTITNLKTLQDADNLVLLCRKNNISIISVAFKQDEDDEVLSGEAFYHSKIAPISKGYEREDILKYLIKKAHENHIKVKAWIPQFHDQVAYNKDPAWRMMVYTQGKVMPFGEKSSEYFVNPLHTGVQQYELSIIKEIVSNYDIDGVVLDWIRFNSYNMDLSDYTRQLYTKRFGYDPITIDFTKENPRRTQWNTYRTDEIARYIQKVRDAISKIKPSLHLGVYILSPAWKEIGQDPEKFAQSIDSVSPMCYFDDWNYPVDWIYGKRYDAILPLVRNKVKNREIIPVFDTYWDYKTYVKIFEHLQEIETISWFEYGKWTQEKLEKVKENSTLR